MSKHTEDNIVRINELAEQHFGVGEVRFVGVKYETNVGWIAKLKMVNFMSLSESAETAKEATYKLKKRMKKIIKRYNEV